MMISQPNKSGHRFSAIVPAAGIGQRMGANRPKQYLQIGAKSILEWTLERLISHPLINHIVLPVNPDDQYIQSLPCYGAPWLTVITGGKERADSVLAGLQALSNEPENKDEWVLVHDAARPCVTHDDISKLLALADKGLEGGILACPVRDTMKRAQPSLSHQVLHSESREHLWHALTPQFFPRQQLESALALALSEGANITDEASAIERQNGVVHLIEGLSSNIKVTRPEDLALAEFYLNTRAIQHNAHGEKYESDSPQ